MNLLFIANRFPYPPYRGDKLKIYNLAQKLSKEHTLYLLTFVQTKEDLNHIPELEVYFDKVRVVYLPKYASALRCFVKMFSSKPFQVIYFESSRFRKLVKNFINNNKIDAVHIQHIRMAQYGKQIDGVRKILDIPDAISLFWERRSKLKQNIFKRIFDNIEYKKILKYERIINEFDLNLVCSTEDKKVLETTHNSSNVDILPNGVDTNQFRSIDGIERDPNKIIFTGNMGYSPNVDGVLYFVNEIFPVILKKIPNAKFHIVGQNPGNKILSLASDNVIVAGFVKDLNLEYNTSSVAVSPIRFGAGTLNKVLEPMAVGIPVVSTHVGFEGLGINSGEGVILANSKDEFAQSTLGLLSDVNYNKQTGLKGQQVIKQKFSWDTIARRLEGYFKG